jgi:hypothetical protein
MSVKITELQAENFKRVKAVQITPSPSGLTVIGGNNNQGKTSVLDAIAWALGGDRFRPSAPTRDGSVIPPNIKIALSNGLEVERSGKNGTLKIYDPSGRKAGQQLINSFVETFALDLPKFMNQTAKEKAQTLLQIIGIGDQLRELDLQEQRFYNERLSVGRIAKQKEGHARDLPYWDNVPKEPVSAAELIQRHQEILSKNAENARLRAHRNELEIALKTAVSQAEELHRKIDQLRNDLTRAEIDAEDLHDESTAELEESLKNIDALNVKIRQNMDRAKAEEEAAVFKDQYDELASKIEDVRAQRMELLNGADMPLPGLSVSDGEITFNGQKWDNMSGSEQLRAATAIVRRLNPDCGFVLLDKLEQMDLVTLQDFGEWLISENLQAIATRVSSGDECSIIIEDGYSRPNIAEKALQKTWKEGEF